MSAHDRWLADYHAHAMEVYCANRNCTNAEGVTVTWYREYGQTWIEPEECPRCGGELLENPPPEEDDDEDAPQSDSAGISAPSTPPSVH